MRRGNIDENVERLINLSIGRHVDSRVPLTYHISIQIHPASPLPRFEFSMRSASAKNKAL